MANLKGKWSGVFEQFSHDTSGSFAVALTVESVSGDGFEGTMDWPDFEDTRTKAQGIIEGDLIKWSETEYVRGDDAVLHGLYVARLEGSDELAGEWMDPKHTIYPAGPRFGTPGGRFRLKKQ